MNQKLTEEIAYHVLSNMGVLPSNFVNKDLTKSITDPQFLLKEKTNFQTAEGKIINGNIYGCQVSVTNSKDFKILLADCTIDKSIPEHCLIVQLQDAPAFGVYLIFNKLVDDPPDSEALIGVSTNNKLWMPCATYLQGTFLAGMEQLRDIGYGWRKCENYQELYEQLLSFINFHSNFFGGSDEGEEN